MVLDRKRPSRLLAATTETQRKVQSTKKMAGMVSKRAQRQERCQKLSRMMRLLLHHSLANCPPFLELSSESDSVMENSFSVLSFEPLHDPKLEVCRFVKSGLAQYLSWGDLIFIRSGWLKSEKSRARLGCYCREHAVQSLLTTRRSTVYSA